MKRFMNKKVLVVGVAVALAIAAGGAAFAFFSSTGSGTGSAQTGKSVPLLIDQLSGTPMYNSIIDPTAYQWSFAYTASTDAIDFGNEITLANGGGLLTDVTVAMSNWNPVSLSVPIPITLTIYDASSGGLPGAVIGSDLVNLTPPGTVAGDADGTNPAGIDNFNVTFDFTSQHLTLPSDVVYGISYNDNTQDDNLNVNLSYEPPSVGSDTYPGYLFVQQEGSGYASPYGSGTVIGGPYGQITCDTVSSTFAQYSTASGNGGNCGLSATPGPSGQIPGPNLVPAVEFDTSSMGDLYPGGPAQPINFSITNPGGGNEQVQTVTISVASYDGDVETVAGDSGSAVSGCVASWFTINGSPSATLTLNQNIPGGGTIDWVGAANISLTNEPFEQDACQGINIGLNFSSN